MAVQLDQLDRQRRGIMWLVGLLLASFCGALLLTTWSGDAPSIQLEQRWPSMVGLCGLIVLFVLYVQNKHRQLAALERKLRDVAVREATLQARFSELVFLF